MEENANLATYLLSDYSSWMSGAVVVLDGGNLPYMAGMFSQLTKVWFLGVTSTLSDLNAVLC